MKLRIEDGWFYPESETQGAIIDDNGVCVRHDCECVRGMRCSLDELRRVVTEGPEISLYIDPEPYGWHEHKVHARLYTMTDYDIEHYREAAKELGI